MVSHIDSDHIAGAIAVARDLELAPLIGEIWFNGPQHLSGDGSRSLTIDEGDILIDLIERNGWTWNGSFAQQAAMRRPEEMALWPAGEGGPEIRLLGPYPEALRTLAAKWTGSVPAPAPEYVSGAIVMGEEDEKLHVYLSAQERYVPDPSNVNDTSIAFVLRFHGCSVAVCSDSHAETLVRSIDADFGGALTVDVATLPHHGSAANMSIELAKRLQARTWIVSTDGGRQREKKPTRASVARVLTSRRPDGHPVEIAFNYDQQAAKLWYNTAAQAEFNYSVRYAADDEDFIAIHLPSPPDAY
ncbi:hypothetical protein [Bradyrhizobium yuanmingense]|uniref:hypothetical protein n=1 Tax=Bradyrhizobium yuanmingense TaxID=108015 RepID=UPI0035177C58